MQDNVYGRVIPRDLFNEANLLKCYGQIYLNLERMPSVRAELVEDGDTTIGFLIGQDYSTGGISVANVALMVRGRRVKLERPLNARQPYPLWTWDENDDEIRVFNDDGSFTLEMVDFLNGS